MAFRSLQRRLKKEDPGFALMEAVTAAGFAAVALSASLVILNKQAEMATRARGLAMVQAAVNEDINAIRHQARNWRWNNNYYFNPAVSGANPPNIMIYTPTTECHAWSSKGYLELAARTDMNYYEKLSGAISITRSGLISKTVPGYQIRRQYTFPTTTSQVNTSTSAVTDQAPYTLRVTYTVNSVKTNKDGGTTLKPFPFDQTTDVQLSAQYSC